MKLRASNTWMLGFVLWSSVTVQLARCSKTTRRRLLLRSEQRCVGRRIRWRSHWKPRCLAPQTSVIFWVVINFDFWDLLRSTYHWYTSFWKQNWAKLKELTLRGAPPDDGGWKSFNLPTSLKSMHSDSSSKAGDEEVLDSRLAGMVRCTCAGSRALSILDDWTDALGWPQQASPRWQVSFCWFVMDQENEGCHEGLIFCITALQWTLVCPHLKCVFYNCCTHFCCAAGAKRRGASEEEQASQALDTCSHCGCVSEEPKEKAQLAKQAA